MIDRYPVDLIKKYLDGQCTPQEELEIERWFEHYESGDRIFYNDDQELINQAMARSLAGIKRKVAQGEPDTGIVKISFKQRSRWLAGAAAALLFLTVGYFLQKEAAVKPVASYQSVKSDIPPGNNKAILTLANGKHIVLNDARNGKLATQGNITITKAADGQIIYNTMGQSDVSSTSGKSAFNTITTPRGGEWQIILPDGSHVWLNAASSITYPSLFSDKKRLVELKGEAYFEVAKNPAKPFVVSVKGRQQIEVLGTHFNVEAYAEDRIIKTTLLEGSVRLSASNKQVILKPGQIAVNDIGQSLQIKDADLDEVMAWKNGLFVFNYENITTIMKRISRWYDIDVVFEGNLQNVNFVGNYSRYKSLSNLLKYIQLTEKVHFKLEERRLTVIANN